MWVGGLAESGVALQPRGVDKSTRLNGAVVGQTFTCLLAKTFVSLKRGDRFFYENAPSSIAGTTSTAFALSINMFLFSIIIF